MLCFCTHQIKATDCISGMTKPNAHVDGIAPALKSFVDSGKSAARENVSWFLPPSKNVALPSLQLPSKLLTQELLEALPTSDRWIYVVDGFAPEVYPQVLSATTSYPLPHQRSWR